MGLPTQRNVEGVPGRGNSLIKGMELKDMEAYWGNLTGSAGPSGSRPGLHFQPSPATATCMGASDNFPLLWGESVGCVRGGQSRGRARVTEKELAAIFGRF